MPRSLPERELEIAQTLLAKYKSNSQNIVVSFPQSQADEDLEPSPLIKHYDRQTLNQLMVDQTDKISLKPDITELVEDKAPAYDQAIEIVSTGSSLLQNQAACPFNAFAISSSPYAVVRDLISLTMKPISLESTNFWASASNRIDSNVSGRLRIR